MNRKTKGTLNERALKKILEEKGFFVVRASGSGCDGVSPDLIALHTTKKIAFECKAWKNSLSLRKEKVLIMKEWERTTGMQVLIAWRQPRREWRFFPLAFLKENEKGYALNKNEYDTGLTLQDVLQ
ncbi:MAG: hypothetical protein ABH803_03050 [Candidatus Micrarchaeota archaeon]